MAKIQILDINGKKTKEMTTKLFDEPVRLDIIQKIAEIQKEKQPYAPFFLAGNQTSASGNVLHTRHDWKSDRGKGISRVPKKRMSDKGERFTWVGAVIPGTRGGRRAHPPKILARIKTINKREMKKGFLSALTMTASENLVKEKYSSLAESKAKLNLPLVVESKIISLKTKAFFESLKSILGEYFDVAIQEKSIRSGIAGMRNRKYKKTAGILLVLGNNEMMKINGIDTVNTKELKIGDLASNGARLVLFTEQSIKDLEERVNK